MMSPSLESEFESHLFDLPWDSATFGFRCSELAFFPDQLLVPPEEARVFLAKHEIRICAARTRPGNSEEEAWLCRSGFRLVEQTVLVQGVPSRVSGSRAQLVSRPMPEDLDQLNSLFAGTFVHGRYHADPLFPNDLADRRYANWARSVSASAGAGVAMVLRDGSNIAAYIQVSLGSGGLVIDLGPVVALNARGQGFGGIMLDAAIRHAHEASVQSVTARVSAVNLPVLAIYRARNFSARHALNVWHLGPEG